MNWKEKCFSALNAEKMFESYEHSTRFQELVDCFSGYPFFTKGLCKCIYLSAWDEEHFCIMLETLTDLSLGREKNTDEMREKGDLLAEEQTDGEYYVYHLSNAFLDGKPFDMELPESLDAGFRYIIDRALKASAIIDQL